MVVMWDNYRLQHVTLRDTRDPESLLLLQSCLTRQSVVNHPYAGNRIFQANKLNTMAADALAPCVTRSSAAVVLAV